MALKYETGSHYRWAHICLSLRIRSPPFSILSSGPGKLSYIFLLFLLTHHCSSFWQQSSFHYPSVPSVRDPETQLLVFLWIRALKSGPKPAHVSAGNRLKCRLLGLTQIFNQCLWDWGSRICMFNEFSRSVFLLWGLKIRIVDYRTSTSLIGFQAISYTQSFSLTQK